MCTDGKPCLGADFGDGERDEAFTTRKIARDDPNAAALHAAAIADLQADFAAFDPKALDGCIVATLAKDGTIKVTGGGNQTMMSRMIIGILKLFMGTNAALDDSDSIPDVEGSTPRTPTNDELGDDDTTLDGRVTRAMQNMGATLA